MNLQLTYVSKPGEITNEDYHYEEESRKYYSSSQLKNYLISPKYARYVWLNPEKKDTDALELGSVYHAILESRVNNTPMPYVAFDGPINERTGKPYGRDTLAYQNGMVEFESENQGALICSNANLLTANIMVDELLKGNDNLSPIVQSFIKNGIAEQSHYIEYQGGLFKFRTDVKTKNLIVDWKTTQLENPKPENFERQIIERGYHISAAMYQFLDHELTGRWRRFYWVVQEKQPPYDFTIIDSSSWTWDIDVINGEQIVVAGPGAIIFMRLLEEHLICLEKGSWPGYHVFIKPDWRGRRIAKPEAPGWYKAKMMNFIN